MEGKQTALSSNADLVGWSRETTWYWLWGDALPSGSGVVGERVGSGEGGCSDNVFWDDPCLCESQEVERLEGAGGKNGLSTADC